MIQPLNPGGSTPPQAPPASNGNGNGSYQIKNNILKPTFRDGFFFLLAIYLTEHGISLKNLMQTQGFLQ